MGLLFTFRNDYEDGSWKDLLELILSLTELNPLAAPVNFFPVLKHVPFIQKYVSGGMVGILNTLVIYLIIASLAVIL